MLYQLPESQTPKLPASRLSSVTASSVTPKFQAPASSVCRWAAGRDRCWRGHGVLLLCLLLRQGQHHCVQPGAVTQRAHAPLGPGKLLAL